MKESFTLGSVPADEQCAQIGVTDNYEERARQECTVYIEFLERAYAQEHGKEIPKGISMRTKAHEHDFGTYYEVQVSFDDNDKDAVKAAYWFEGSSPTEWDTAAKRKLGLPGHLF